MVSSNAEITEKQRKFHQRLQTDLPLFCKKCLKIKTKNGDVLPFVLNKAQEYLHKQIELQLQEIGMVRILIVKGRQQGCSTYVAGRYYHKATTKKGISVFILSHMAKTTDTLFSLVARFYEKHPPHAKPGLITDNNKKLKFDNDSQYGVGTAGSGEVGRGDTNQLIHGSEVAFFEKTEKIETGLLQTVADVPGTEIIEESTANGIGNYFHRKVMRALEGKGRYRVVFIPWFWQEEYRAVPPKNWKPDAEEAELMQMYDLDIEQIYWRHLKLIDAFGGILWKFKQEYPCTVQEAFQSSTTSLIDPLHVQKAMKSHIQSPEAPLVLGVDPARKGDRTVIVWRRGRSIVRVDKYDDMDTMKLAAILAKIMDNNEVAKCFVDWGMGYGTIDRLKELGYGDIVTGIGFGEKSLEPDKFANKRAEMGIALRDWLGDGEVSMPNDQDIEMDFLAVPDVKENNRGLLLLESKDKIRKDYGKSPDIFDAAILTFALPVRKGNAQNRQRYRKPTGRGKSPSTVLNRIDRGKL